MGICSSCLGRRPSDSEVQSDTSHLLGDAYQPHYGTTMASGSHSVPQPDPEEIRRQRDALERICAQTSDKLIHVTYTDHGANSEYSRLFNERFPPLRPDSSRPSSADAPAADHSETAWLENTLGKSSVQDDRWERVEPVEGGALTIQFGEALGSDRRQLR